MIDPARIQSLNRCAERPGKYVLYWMQQAQRTAVNHALEYAIREADARRLPVVVYFGLTARFPGANRRHFHFMLEGLNETRHALADRGIRMVVRLEPPGEGVAGLAAGAALAVVDRGYLRIQRQWREEAARRLGCPLRQVETDAVVPVETASGKEEYSAATLRPKIRALRARFMQPLTETAPRLSSLGMDIDGRDIRPIAEIMARLQADSGVAAAPAFRGGTAEADRRLNEFLDHRLEDYPNGRHDPNRDCLSGLSPYLHFGQISPLRVALAASRRESPAAEVFLEELVVRRELALNYVYYNPAYDSCEGLPAWARESLRRHEADPRPAVYGPEELERGRTHDPYWNAAQMEMVATGKMHGYMRMYWGKKILEWVRPAAEAFRIAAFLNDRYELDGRDPNGYAGVAWCFGKHDRPWGRRPVFGNVRYMNDRGLRRKFDADAYVAMVGQRIRACPQVSDQAK